jgi:putative ABC transport system permease protein
MAQAAAAIALCFGVVMLCRRFAVHVERETVISLARGLVQMVAVGVVLALLLHGNLLIASLILLAMACAAAVTASRRAPEIKNPLLVCFYAIAAGSSVLLATKTLTTDLVVLVPVGSMIIANAMNACAQAMERFKADVTDHVGLIETGLALGAEPTATVAPYVQTAVYASLLPRLDMLKSLGFVWIPGVMAGMLVSGASPIYAGIFQFIVVAMILAASGIAGLVATLLMRARVFSTAAQLTLRPGISESQHPRETNLAV